MNTGRIRNGISMMGMVLAIVLGTAACAQVPPVTGVITNKYVEDFEEPTLVMKGDNGVEYHFTVTEDQFEDVQINDRFSTSQLDTPSED